MQSFPASRLSPAARYNWGEMGQQVNFFIPNEISHNSGENDAINNCNNV
jgi:hypothetical protein